MKIALIEFGLSHEECIYSQLQFLKHEKDNHVTLICPEGLVKKMNFRDEFDDIFFISEKMQLRDLLYLRRKLILEKFTHVIINTAHGNTVRNFLILPFPSKISFAAVMHKIKKLKVYSIKNFLTRKLNKLIVLNDYLLEKLKPEIRRKFKMESSYMIFYPPYKKRETRKKEGEIWICVPGQVEFKRRDYLKLFNGIKTSGLNPNVHFIFLGNSGHKQANGKEIKRMIKELQVERQFYLWDEFIDINEFHTYIEASDYILPLIHPDHESYTLYTYQITGAFNLAFGYKKSMILHNSFSEYKDFKENAIFYKNDDLMLTINSLKKPAEKVYIDNKLEFEYQAEKYLKFIRS